MFPFVLMCYCRHPERQREKFGGVLKVVRSVEIESEDDQAIDRY